MLVFHMGTLKYVFAHNYILVQLYMDIRLRSGEFPGSTRIN